MHCSYVRLSACPVSHSRPYPLPRCTCRQDAASGFAEMARQLAERERNKKWWQL